MDILSFFVLIKTFVSLNSALLQKMNDDYKTSLSTHNPQQDLAWWDEHYGMLFNIILNKIFILFFKGTKTNNRWPEYEEYRD